MGLRVPLWLELSAAFLVALVISNAATFVVADYQRSNLIRAERLSAIEDRLTALMSLLTRLPEQERAHLLTIASVRHERVSIGATPRVADDAARDNKAEERLRSALLAMTQSDVRVAKRGTPALNLIGGRKRGGLERFSVAIALGPRQWLNAEFHWPEGDVLLPGLLFSGGVAALVLMFVCVWIAYRFSGPLSRLASASTLMQSGKLAAPIPETGPAVLRRASRAFNVMAQRLMAMMDNQRVLLASVGHDLRTPITSLKLKSEFIDDAALKEQFQSSLDELQALTEAALSAARDGIGEEDLRIVDLSSVVESFCVDMAEAGQSVSFAEGGAVLISCRANEIKRAARNLVENAVKYGQRARVCVHSTESGVGIVVDDDGPGIAPGDIDRAFEPFVRLTGEGSVTKPGHGLGLTLARAIARAHGGDITLGNRPEGGLRARLTLCG
jgi:signal transduction histidine kinase